MAGAERYHIGSWNEQGSIMGELTSLDLMGASILSGTVRGLCWGSDYNDGDMPCTITSQANTIADMLFSNLKTLQEITLPTSITSIGYGAFYSCTNLNTITFPSGMSINSIGGYYGDYSKATFSGCSSLARVNICDLSSWCNILFHSNYDNPLYYTNGFYSSTTASNVVTSLIIPEGVTSIGRYAFYYCSNLTSVTIPSSLTEIKYGAFAECNAITRVNTSDIAAWCNIDFGSTPLSYAHKLYLNNELITNLIIPEGVTAISNRAFFNCSSLQSVSFPLSLTSVGDDAFYGCNAITRVNISDIAAWCNINFERGFISETILDPNGGVVWVSDDEDEWEYTVPRYIYSSNPLYYAHKLYLNNELITNLIIPEGVTAIGQGAFFNCSSLQSVSFPRSLTRVGRQAFDGCSNVATVEASDWDSWNNIQFVSYSKEYISDIDLEEKDNHDNSMYFPGTYDYYYIESLRKTTLDYCSNPIYASCVSGISDYSSIVWSSTNTNVATVNNYGTITALSVGNSTISASSNAHHCNLVIVSTPIAVELTAYLAEDGSGDYYCTYYNADDSYVVGDNLAEAYTATVSGSTVTLTPIEGGVILAGTPVVLRSTQETIPLNYAGSDATATYGQNDLIGTSVPLTVSKSDNIYGMKNGTFYLAAGGTIPANRAYLQLNASAGAPSRLDMVIGEATALQRVQDETEAEVWYTLSGVRVERPTKAGIYIKNGKKVLLK